MGTLPRTQNPAASKTGRIEIYRQKGTCREPAHALLISDQWVATKRKQSKLNDLAKKP